jgi:hypothetical protein
MGKSRFEGMETAIREQAKISEAGAFEKAQMDRLQAELDSIDAETKQRIEEIKAQPVNKELIRKQAENEFSASMKQNKRVCDEIILRAEQGIKEAEFEAETEYKQAKLEIEKQRANLANVKEKALEDKERLDIEAKQMQEMAISSIDNTSKTLELRIQKEQANAQKQKKEIEIKLRTLKSRDKIIEEQKASWQKFYEDVVEISKQPPTE